MEIADVLRAFDGSALVRVRATVAHDSYERLVEIPCSAEEHRVSAVGWGLQNLSRTIEKPETVGLKIEALENAAKHDEAISEFSRFYLERREYEVERTDDDRTHDDILREEVAISEISGKKYRVDQQLRSIVSGRTGHELEFLTCHETRQPIVSDEAEKCEITGYFVRAGVLQKCEISGRKVLPVGLERCTVTGKRALKRYLVNSSLSGALMLEQAAIRSAAGRHCSPIEAQPCAWSGRTTHPDDLRRCELTGLPIHFEFVTSAAPYRLLPLVGMLDGVKRNSDEPHRWNDIAERIAAAKKGGKFSVEAAVLSPNKTHLATCSELKTMLGMRTFQVGALYDLISNGIVGRICTGKRTRENWTEVTR